MPSTRDVLIGARRLIENPDKWGQGDQWGAVPAGRLCVRSAVFDASANRTERVLASAMLRAACGEGPGACDIRFNDTHSHAEVLDLFDRAIEAAS